MKLRCTKNSLILALFATAMLLSHAAVFAIGPEYSGSWYNPEQDGHGFSLEYSVLNDGTPVVVAYWYVYDNEGNQIYLVGTGEPQAGNTVTLEFTSTYGMKFGEFDAEQIERKDGGIGVFTFDNEDSGTFNYEPSVWIADAYGLSAISIPVKMLLEVAHANDKPPSGGLVPVLGTWSGRMIYSRNSVAGGACYDADVQISTYLDGKNDSPYMRINSVRSDAGGLEIINYYTFAPGWQAVGAFTAFGEKIEFTLIFSDYGYAEGVWTYDNSDCYGEWTFTKD